MNFNGLNETAFASTFAGTDVVAVAAAIVEATLLVVVAVVDDMVAADDDEAINAILGMRMSDLHNNVI
jgi:hypothetical protein